MSKLTKNIEYIPLNKLIASPRNVRRKHAKVDIDSLAASIGSRGLLQNLCVVPGDDGRFEVEAGGRRRLALNLLAKQGKIAKDWPVPCQVVAREDGVEVSLTENVHRVAMDAMDEVDAYAALVAEGKTPDEVARRFGVERRHVDQRLALAGLSPKIKAAWKRGDVTLDVARAFCLVDDHAQQEAVYRSLGRPITHASTVRARLTDGRVRTSDRLAVFVGLDAYEAAGGKLLHDLFDTVTAGIISARGRDIGSGPYDDYLQIDAPINPGNSGGPMFNAAGEVIGVNTAIYSPSGGNVGIGFSIPAEQARSVVQQIIDRGYVERGWLGVNIQRVTPEIAASFGLNEAKGALVAEVTADSPAAKAGLRPLDLITAYDGRPISSMHELTRAVAETRPGSVKALVIRRGGQEQTLKVKVDALEAPAKPAGRAATVDETSTLAGGLGLEVVDDENGVVIADIVSGSPAEEAGLRAGDRLLMVGDARVTSSKDAQDAVRAARSKGRSAVLVQVERNAAKIFVGVPLSSS